MPIEDIKAEQRSFNVKDTIDALYAEAIEATDNNISAAAKLLGVNVKTVFNWRKSKGYEKKYVK